MLNLLMCSLLCRFFEVIDCLCDKMETGPLRSRPCLTSTLTCAFPDPIALCYILLKCEIEDHWSFFEYIISLTWPLHKMMLWLDCHCPVFSWTLLFLHCMQNCKFDLSMSFRHLPFLDFSVSAAYFFLE